MFEPLWNRNYVDHVQLTAAEDHRYRFAGRLL
jgi:glucose-6-phosphate 1-dehydrogenase